jgi:hypothetical protein
MSLIWWGNIMNKVILSAIFTLFAAAFSAKGQVILAENFDGVSVSDASAVATVDAWDTQNGLTMSGLNVTITNTSEPGSGSNYEGVQSSALDVDYRVWDAGDTWTITFDTFTVGSTITLDSFDFDSFATNNGGAFRTNTTANIQWTLGITGTLGYSESNSTTVVYNQGVSFTTTSDSISLAGWANLVTGETYTMTLTSTGTNTIGDDSTYSALDGFSISQVPEPSTALLLGIGGLGLYLLRRRR